MKLSCEKCLQFLPLLLEPETVPTEGAIASEANGTAPVKSMAAGTIPGVAIEDEDDTLESPPTRTELEAHLVTCPECAREWQRLKNIQSTLGEFAVTAAPPNLRSRVRAAIETEMRAAEKNKTSDSLTAADALLVTDTLRASTESQSIPVDTARDKETAIPRATPTPQAAPSKPSAWDNFLRLFRPKQAAWAGSALLAALVLMLMTRNETDWVRLNPGQNQIAVTDEPELPARPSTQSAPTANSTNGTNESALKSAPRSTENQQQRPPAPARPGSSPASSGPPPSFSPGDASGGGDGGRGARRATPPATVGRTAPRTIVPPPASLPSLPPSPGKSASVAPLRADKSASQAAKSDSRSGRAKISPAPSSAAASTSPSATKQATPMLKSTPRLASPPAALTKPAPTNPSAASSMAMQAGEIAASAIAQANADALSPAPKRFAHLELLPDNMDAAAILSSPPPASTQDAVGYQTARAGRPGKLRGGAFDAQGAGDAMSAAAAPAPLIQAPVDPGQALPTPEAATVANEATTNPVARNTPAQARSAVPFHAAPQADRARRPEGNVPGAKRPQGYAGSMGFAAPRGSSGPVGAAGPVMEAAPLGPRGPEGVPDSEMARKGTNDAPPSLVFKGALRGENPASSRNGVSNTGEAFAGADTSPIKVRRARIVIVPGTFVPAGRIRAVGENASFVTARRDIIWEGTAQPGVPLELTATLLLKPGASHVEFILEDAAGTKIQSETVEIPVAAP